MLSDKEIRKLIEEHGFIENYVDLEVQLQQCGFDLTLDYVEKPSFGKEVDRALRRQHRTIIDFDNSRRKLTTMIRLQPIRYGIGKFYSEEWYSLPEGSYVFHSRERIRVPPDVGGHGHLRSSLQRVGITYTSALYDPGFYGHLTFSVHIPAPGLRITRGARFCQITAWRLESPADKLYTGVYKEETLEEKVEREADEKYREEHNLDFHGNPTIYPNEEEALEYEDTQGREEYEDRLRTEEDECREYEVSEGPEEDK